MVSAYEYIFIASIAFSIVSLAYYLLNSLSSLKRQKYVNSEGNDDPEDVTIMVPVYNEDEATFRRCMKGISLQRARIVVVGDSCSEPYKSITKEFSGKFIYHPVRRGKRGSISEGMKYVNTKYVLFVDSDTIIPVGTLASMLSRFGGGVGGVGTAVSARIKSNDNVSYCSEFFEKLKEVVFRTMSVYGGVMVLDGRCAMYRTSLVKEFMLSKEYTENKLFGKKSLLAEDRHLTSYIIKTGFKAVIDYDILVVTSPQKSVGLMFKQMVRWSRAGYLYFFKELVDGTYLNRGLFYSFEMTYMYFFPILFLLLGFMRLDAVFVHGLGNYLAFQASHITYLLELNFARLGHGVMLYLWIQVLVLISVGVFAMAVAARIAKGTKLKTLALGAIALLMMLVASMYGLITIWEQNEWLTR